MSRLTTLGLGLVLVFAVGCSGSDNDSGPEDSGPDIAFLPDTGEPQCGTGIYPCPPYGVNIDDVVANLDFIGYSDPKEHCKEHKDKVMDTTASRRVSFKDFFLGDPDPSCATHKRGLLWVMVSAGWCGPCKSEVSSTQAEYAANNLDQRVGVINIVTETDKFAPVTDEFIKKWISGFQLTMPVVMDPSFKMGAYFDTKAVPFNMLIETKTMKVIYRKTGENLPEIGAKISAYFQGQ